MTRAEFEARTKRFALAIVQLVEELPVGRTADVIGQQLLRAGTSVGANYRASCRSRSRREFIAKMGIVEEEADEAQVSSIRTARRAPRANPQSAIRNPQCS